MGQNTVSSTIPLTKDQFSQVVNKALAENGEQTKTAKEIAEVYNFYKRMWEEDGGRGEIEMVRFDGKMQLSFG